MTNEKRWPSRTVRKEREDVAAGLHTGVERQTQVLHFQGPPLALEPRNIEPTFSLCFTHPDVIFLGIIV